MSSRRRSVSQPDLPSHSKSVSFDLHGRTKAERRKGKSQANTSTLAQGYETDDSDSTIDGNDRSRDHHHRHAPPPPFRSSPPTTAQQRSSSNDSHYHHRHHQQISKPSDIPPLRSAPRDSSDSEATIELPARFDAQGRKLPEEGDDPIADTFDHLLHGIFANGRTQPHPTFRMV